MVCGSTTYSPSSLLYVNGAIASLDIQHRTGYSASMGRRPRICWLSSARTPKRASTTRYCIRIRSSSLVLRMDARMRYSSALDSPCLTASSCSQLALERRLRVLRQAASND